MWLLFDEDYGVKVRCNNVFDVFIIIDMIVDIFSTPFMCLCSLLKRKRLVSFFKIHNSGLLKSPNPSKDDFMQKHMIPRSSQDLLGRFLSAWRNRRVLKEIVPPFLDIGCGDNRLVQMAGTGIGIDIMDYGKADIIVKDFSALPFQSGSFNSIAIVGSLNYFDAPEPVLFECERVLAQDGKLIITMIDPGIGRVWHHIREPWAKQPGFKLDQLIGFTQKTGFPSNHRSRFMLGLNNLYVFRKK